jgi:hypothetical protein
MNWGTKIILGLASFMIFIVVLGIMMFNSKKDALVDTDYYEKGINYNQTYNSKEQTQTDHAKPGILINQDMLLLTFTQKATGTIKLMRTSDKNLDIAIPFTSNVNQQVIVPAANLQKGSWRLIITWASNAKNYLYEQEITIK